MDVKTIAVIGAGTMGRGIAQVSAMAGFRTRLYDVSADALARAVSDIHKNLEKGKQLGQADRRATAIRAARCSRPEPNLEEAVSTADFIIEAVPEDAGTESGNFRTVRRLSAGACHLREQHIITRDQRNGGRFEGSLAPDRHALL